MFGFQEGRDSSCRNPHAQSCGGLTPPRKGPIQEPSAPTGDFPGEREGEKVLKKNSVRLLLAHRWEGVQGVGAVSSASQIFQLLLPGLCFALCIYTKGGHSMSAEKLCSLSTLCFCLFLSREVFVIPSPSLCSHIQAQRIFTLFPSLSPSFLHPSLWGWILLPLSYLVF